MIAGASTDSSDTTVSVIRSSRCVAWGERRLALLGRRGSLSGDDLVDSASRAVDVPERRARFLDRRGHVGRFAADVADVAEGALGGTAGCVRQLADLMRDDGEAAAMVAGSSRLDRRVEGQQARLVGDRRDLTCDLLRRFGDLAEAGAAVYRPRNSFARGSCGLQRVLGGRFDSVAGPREHRQRCVDLLEQRLSSVCGARVACTRGSLLALALGFRGRKLTIPFGLGRRLLALALRLGGSLLAFALRSRVGLELRDFSGLALGG